MPVKWTLTKNIPGHWGWPIKKGPHGCSSKFFHSPSKLHAYYPIEGDPWGILSITSDWKLLEKVMDWTDQIYSGVWPSKPQGWTVVLLTARMFPHEFPRWGVVQVCCGPCWPCVRFSTCFGEIVEMHIGEITSFQNPHHDAAMPGLVMALLFLVSTQWLISCSPGGAWGLWLGPSPWYAGKCSILCDDDDALTVTQKNKINVSNLGKIYLALKRRHKVSIFLSRHLKFPSWFAVQMRSFLQGEKCLLPQLYL